LIETGSISTIWPMFGAANQLLGTLALCIGTTVLIKMRKARYLWITVAPMVFVGAITLTGCYELAVLFVHQAVAAGAAEPVFPLYLDAALVGLVALLAVVVLADSLRQWHGYLIEGKPYTSSEVLVGPGGVPLGGAAPARSEGLRITVDRCC